MFHFQVSKIFWWDNFDRNVETTTGAGSVHTTPGVAFQEESSEAILRNEDVSIEKSKRRSIHLPPPVAAPRQKINPKIEPPSFAGMTMVEARTEVAAVCLKLLTLWKSVRYLKSIDQLHPRFVGWIICLFKIADSKVTKMTYLPPLPTHISFDVGAAMKAFHVVWNDPDAWSDIIIHLGDFQAMVAFFGMIGKLVTGSGFEDVLFQAGLCSSGSISGVMSGKHYNRCWTVHEAFAEALERLFIERFMPEVPEVLAVVAQSSPGNEDVRGLLDEEIIDEYDRNYQALNTSCWKGDFGKTPQFWCQYMKLVDRQHQFHYSINRNDFDLRMLFLKESLPLCFATNRLHYARYGTYYLKSLESLEFSRPGAKEELCQQGLSVRRNKLGIGQAVDLAEEQTYTKNAKTAGLS